MKKLFISQPMNGKTKEEILRERKKAIKQVKKLLKEPVEIIDSFFQTAPAKAGPLWCLDESLELLSTADIVYFTKGWENARGCKIEHESAVQYNITIIEEENKMDALFVIDMNKGFCEEGNLAAQQIKEIVPNINKFYKENRDNLSTVIAFTDCHDENSREFEYMPPHCDNKKEQELVDGFEINFSAIIEKNSTNGFHEFLNIDNDVFVGFKNNIEFWSIENFYITGCLTSYCVMQFALSLQTWLNEYSHLNDNIKRKVIVLKDCCADVHKDIEDWAIKYMKLNGIEVR